ncbi:MAG: four helix bundle protein [Planctomycetes bacterium]|nr:four helix bundle protein [Planctomycetota bacterium]
MKYSRFEDLPVWKTAIDLAVRIYTLTNNPSFSMKGDLSDQLRRAALSVSNNIAEGFERGTTAELLQFLYIARGSAGEVRSMLHFVEQFFGADPSRRASGNQAATAAAPRSTLKNTPSGESKLKSQISNLRLDSSKLTIELAHIRELAESCSRQIRAWADSLQNSDISGQRHLTDQSHAAYQQKRRADAFMKQIDETVNARVAEWSRKNQSRAQGENQSTSDPISGSPHNL